MNTMCSPLRGGPSVIATPQMMPTRARYCFKFHLPLGSRRLAWFYQNSQSWFYICPLSRFPLRNRYFGFANIDSRGRSRMAQFSDLGWFNSDSDDNSAAFASDKDLHNSSIWYGFNNQPRPKPLPGWTSGGSSTVPLFRARVITRTE